jgi:hypothetical protein
MAKRTPKSPNPNGKNGKPLSIDLPFEEAIKAALETEPPGPKPKKKAQTPRK